MKYDSHSVGETGKIAQEILGNLDSRNVILLQGELGAGKTTFCQNVLGLLGATGPFTSPTFEIMKRYEVGKLKIQNLPAGRQGSKFHFIYHFDCYRVGSRDILELGWEEIVGNPKNLVLVEWPEKIKDILPRDSVKILFEVKGENERGIQVDFAEKKESKK